MDDTEHQLADVVIHNPSHVGRVVPTDQVHPIGTNDRQTRPCVRPLHVLDRVQALPACSSGEDGVELDPELLKLWRRQPGRVPLSPAELLERGVATQGRGKLEPEEKPEDVRAVDSAQAWGQPRTWVHEGRWGGEGADVHALAATSALVHKLREAAHSSSVHEQECIVPITCIHNIN